MEKDTTRCKESHRDSEILLGALNALQDKNAHLENSLSAETRIKLDLFSALGEVKRQLEIRESKYKLFYTIVLLSLITYNLIKNKCFIISRKRIIENYYC